MKLKAAIADEVNAEWEVREVELAEDRLRAGEILIKMSAAGLCHTDEHIRQGELPAKYPLIGGHEGAGVALAVGPDVKTVKPGDHLVLTFRPSCGLCRFCVAGRPNLCVKVSEIQQGDPDSPFTEGDQSLNPQSLLATFAEYSIVRETSCVVIDPDIPMDVAALLGCAVPTGYGAAVHAAEIRSGEHCIVVGAGGVGMNAVQGARVAGAASVAVVDLSETKRRTAREFGADAAVASIKEASEYIAQVTGGLQANAVILTVPISQLAHEALDVLDAGGRLVLAALGDPNNFRLDVPVNRLVMQDISIRGTVMGSARLRDDIPKILSLYRQGKFKLNELISQRFSLEQIQGGYEALYTGDMVRAVISYT